VRGDKTRVAAMEAFRLQVLKAPGLRAFKQVDIYKKFLPFVPRGYWEDTCPIPSDEVLAQVKDESSKKRKTKVTKEKSSASAQGQECNRFGGGDRGCQERRFHRK
jgi:hypothetical protein